MADGKDKFARLSSQNVKDIMKFLGRNELIENSLISRKFRYAIRDNREKSPELLKKKLEYYERPEVFKDYLENSYSNKLQQFDIFQPSYQYLLGQPLRNRPLMVSDDWKFQLDNFFKIELIQKTYIKLELCFLILMNGDEFFESVSLSRNDIRKSESLFISYDPKSYKYTQYTGIIVSQSLINYFEDTTNTQLLYFDAYSQFTFNLKDIEEGKTDEADINFHTMCGIYDPIKRRLFILNTAWDKKIEHILSYLKRMFYGKYDVEFFHFPTTPLVNLQIIDQNAGNCTQWKYILAYIFAKDYLEALNIDNENELDTVMQFFYESVRSVNDNPRSYNNIASLFMCYDPVYLRMASDLMTLRDANTLYKNSLK